MADPAGLPKFAVLMIYRTEEVQPPRWYVVQLEAAIGLKSKSSSLEPQASQNGYAV